MRRIKLLTFKELVNENKQELLKNDKEMEALEKRIDEKYVKQANHKKTSAI